MPEELAELAGNRRGGFDERGLQLRDMPEALGLTEAGFDACRAQLGDQPRALVVQQFVDVGLHVGGRQAVQVIEQRRVTGVVSVAASQIRGGAVPRPRAVDDQIAGAGRDLIGITPRRDQAERTRDSRSNGSPAADSALNRSSPSKNPGCPAIANPPSPAVRISDQPQWPALFRDAVIGLPGR